MSLGDLWDKKCFILAHRGDTKSFPENSLGAFRSALEKKADGVEFDVHLSADGVPVVIHDETLKRTTGKRGKVSLLSATLLEQLLLLDGNNRVTTERIPTLSTTLKALFDNAIVNVELHYPER